MDVSATYNVVATGELQPGFDLAEVQDTFAEVIKTTPEKAKAVVGTKKVLKSKIDIKTANAYKKKLESIGLVIELIENARPEPEKPAFSLALEPTEEELNKSSEPEVPEPVDDGTIECPKCNFRQEKTEQCVNCGVYMHKVQPAADQSGEMMDPAPGAAQEKVSDEDEVEDTDALSPKALGAAAAAAVAGALLWKFIAVAFDYELGLVAWLIGGAVGFAAASFGSRGQVAGVVCAVLTVVSIMSGKYIALESIQAEWTSALTEQLDTQEFKYIYEEELTLGGLYVEEATDDASIKQFMANYGYSESLVSDQISDTELDDFKVNVAPILERFAYDAPSFEEWMQTGFLGQMQELSTWELMKESFGLVDVVFLLLGLATAFSLGSRQER